MTHTDPALSLHATQQQQVEALQRHHSTQIQQKDEWGKEEKEGPLPAAPACGLTAPWLVEGEDRAGWSQTSAPGTTALNLAWGGEACCPQAGTGDHTKQQQRVRQKRTERVEKKENQEEKTMRRLESIQRQ